MASGELPAPLQDYDYFAKVVLLGSAAVGKSSLLLRFTQNLFPDSYSCTLGVDFQTKTLQIEGKRMKLQVWDTAGQERFTPMTKCYLRNTNGCIVVYDISNRDSFLRVPVWTKEFREANSTAHVTSLLVVGNKVDCAENRVVTTKEGRELAESLGANFLEASAKMGTAVEEVFEVLGRDVYEKMKGRGEPSERSSGKVKLKAGQKGEKRKCC